MKYLVPVLSILFGWHLIYSYQHRPTDNRPAQPTPAVHTYKVVRVIDGDTIQVSINGITETVRFIGLDTPETVDPRKLTECFGLEASRYTKNMLEGHSVRVEADSTQGDKDKYGRLLRYVFLEQGVSFNRLLIYLGYAREYTYNKPYKYQEAFKEAQQLAHSEKRGLWGACN